MIEYVKKEIVNKDRFKFRAWYNNTEMVYGIEKMQNFSDWVNETNQDPVMQCTSLKDKNGKLIYEGDIVKSDFDLFSCAVNPRKFNVGSVIFSDFCAGYVIASDNKDFSPYKNAIFGKVEANNCEVIGNIYENSELIGE